MIINNKVTKYPIIQGGMGIRISMNKLATACINAGIAATISCAQPAYNKNLNSSFYENPFLENCKVIEEEIRKVREHTNNGILGVNFMYALTNFDKYAEFLANQDIDFVISGAGLPMDLPKYFVGSSVKLAFIVSSARACKLLLKNWKKKYNTLPEFIVVEGPLAGGHLGFTKDELSNSTYKNLSEICKEVINMLPEYSGEKNIQVIAAGGISTNKDVTDLLDIGCDGVQIATKFIATYECDAHINYKNMIVNASKEDIVQVVSPAGLPARAIKNNLTKNILYSKQKVLKCTNCLKSCSKVDIPYCISEKLGNSALGDAMNGMVFTGAKAYLIEKIVSVEEVIKRLVDPKLNII